MNNSWVWFHLVLVLLSGETWPECLNIAFTTSIALFSGHVLRITNGAHFEHL